MSESPDSGDPIDSGDPVLPEQTSDDLADPADSDADDPEDLDRFLRDVPPHHGD